MNVKSIFLLGLVALMVIAPATATITITFQELGLAPQDVKIYNSTGSLVTETNTTGTYVFGVGNETLYTVQLQPSYTNRSPTDFLDTILSIAQEYTIPLVILFGVVVLFAKGRR